MTNSHVPQIFSSKRAQQRRRRMHALSGPERARFLLDYMVEEALERLAFVKHVPEHALVIGDATHTLGAHLESDAAQVEQADLIALSSSKALDIESPYSRNGFDFIAILGLLDAVNDLPGALIHIRHALAPGGLAIASFIGGGSLPQLRRAMMNADGERPAARLHPMVDPRAAPQLLQRAGWKDPVVDTQALKVRYRSLDQLVCDLRDQGLTNALADSAPSLGKAAQARAREAFLEGAEEDGKVTEIFEIVTLTGRRSLAGT